MASLRLLDGLRTSSRARASGSASTRVSEDPVKRRNGHGDYWAELRLEIARSRRFGRPFGLVRVEGNTRPPSFGAVLRSIDRVWTADGVTYLLLPETDREAAQSLRGRLLRELPAELEGCSLSVAAFPEDGLTSGALLTVLRPTRERARAPEGRPAFVPLAESPAVHA